jgi:hypothetical protein
MVFRLVFRVKTAMALRGGAITFEREDGSFG